MRALLRSVSSAESVEAGEAISRQLRTLSAWRQASTVALYASLPGEVATTALIRSAWAEGRRVLLPRVVGEGRLVFAEHLASASLVAGAFGVPEPPEGAAVVDLREADLVLVPGVAFDRRGGRLGRGAGYYDRALARLGSRGPRRVAPGRDGGATRTIGVAFDRQLVEAVPMDARDVRVDAVATPVAIHGVPNGDGRAGPNGTEQGER